MSDAAHPQTPPQGWGTHARALFVLGLPLVGSQVAGFAIHMTDTLLLGWYSVVSLAAGTIATSFYFNLWILGAGFGNAVMPMVAGAVAAGDTVRARRVARMALWLSLGFTAVAMPLFWQSEALLLAIGQKPEVADEAQKFLRIVCWGMFPALAQNVFRSYLAAHHRTAVLLWITLGSLVLNGVVAWALIFGHWGLPELGIRGAAITSVTVQVVTAVVLGVYAAWVLPEARLFQRMWKSDSGALRDVARLGWPIGITSLSEGALFTASAVMMGWIGAVELAAHGIALQIAALAFMFHLGMSQAATIRAGGAFGRRDEGELRAIAWAAIIVSMSFGLFIVVLFVSAPQALVTVFVDPTEPERATLIAVGGTLVLLAALFQFADATQVVALSLLRGVQDTTVPMALAAVSYWLVGVPASYVLAFTLGLGAVGLWLGLTVGLATAAVLLMARFWGRAVRIGRPAHV